MSHRGTEIYNPNGCFFPDSIEWVWWVSISGTKRPPVRGRAPFADPLDDFPDRTSFHFDEGLPQWRFPNV